MCRRYGRNRGLQRTTARPGVDGYPYERNGWHFGDETDHGGRSGGENHHRIRLRRRGIARGGDEGGRLRLCAQRQLAESDPACRRHAAKRLRATWNRNNNENRINQNLAKQRESLWREKKRSSQI